MEFLPLEVVDIIALKLSAKDLAACCATSHSWRDTFNQDLFWRRFSKQETAVYLASAPCRVEPAFISPEVEGSDLDSVCQWRMNYMRENHLLNNWRLGRFRKEQLKSVPIISSNNFINDIFFLFYQEDFIIALYFKKIELWDLRSDPVPYIKELCCLLPCWNVSYASFCGDRLIVVQHLAVLVFQINLMQPTWPPEHTFFFEKDEPTDFIRATNFIQNNRTYFTQSNSVLVGKYLISINTKFERCMHIWDVVNCFKLKEERLEESNKWRFYQIKHSLTSLDIIVYLYIKGELRKQVLVYSLLNCTFYPYVYDTSIPGHCVLHGDKIMVNMGSPNIYWLISNYKTGEQIQRIELSNCLNLHSKVFDDKLIYKSNKGLNQINLSSGEIKQFLDAGAYVKDFQILGDKFICTHVIRQSEGIGWEDLVSFDIEVWEICDTSKPLKLRLKSPRVGFMKTNATNSKLIIAQGMKLSIINLW